MLLYSGQRIKWFMPQWLEDPVLCHSLRTLPGLCDRPLNYSLMEVHLLCEEGQRHLHSLVKSGLMAKREVEEKERWNDEGHFRIGFKCLMDEVSQSHITYLAKPDKPVITSVPEHVQPRSEDNDKHSDDEM